MAKAKVETTTDGVRILHGRYMKGQEERVASAASEREKLGIAEQIYALRTSAELSQKELAQRVGTTQSVISRLEDADYDGHSLAMLERIAQGLGCRVCVHFVRQEEPCGAGG